MKTTTQSPSIVDPNGEVDGTTYTLSPDTIIDRPYYKIDFNPNNNIEVFKILNNENVKYLPINMHESFPNLLEYEVTGCKVGEVRYDNFKNMKQLKEIKLNNNKIQSIAPSTFDDARQLEKIHFVSNKLTSLSPELFQNLQKLRRVYFSKNEIVSLSGDLFDMNDKLEEAHFDRNKIESIGVNIFDDKDNLKYVNLELNECINKFFGALAGVPAMDHYLKNIMRANFKKGSDCYLG